MMRFKKVYGKSQLQACLFCEQQATTKTSQGVPVCRHHTKEQLPDFICSCGDYLDARESKYGLFFTCMNCGSISLAKALEINGKPQPKTTPKKHLETDGQEDISHLPRVEDL